MPKQPRDPFELRLNDEQHTTLALFLCDELQKGLDARATAEIEVDYWWQLYEQARTRTGRHAPWPDAADLTSHIPSEKVDALHARLVRTVLGVSPIWSVEGWGEAADRAPFVEEFHQWKAEEGRLQNTIDRLALISLVEPRGLVEVYEGTEMRVTRKRVMAKVKTDPLTGGIVYDTEMEPEKELGADGKFVEAGPQDIAAETVVDSYERVRTGPVERVIPYRDSVILPGHARDKEDIWGYGKRLWRRYADLQRKAAQGLYDKDAVERMTSVGDREADPALQRSLQDVAPTEAGQAEKELWELLVLVDLNDLFKSQHLPTLRSADYNGARWFLVTLHLPSQQMLRIQHDDLERSRFVPVILYPRPDRVTEGYSLVGHKLITVAEEHTAVRNMRADRAALQVSAPIKRLSGALWDPYDQPLGPKAVIDVRSQDEVEPMVIPDVTQHLVQWELNIERTGDRIAGANDIASGQVTQAGNKTLGEVQMATANAEVRMDLITRRFQEAMEDIAQIRHAILKRTLAEMPDGVEPPQSLIASLEGRGVDVNAYMPDRKLTAAMLEGAFRFKPRGSVETADPMRQQQNFVQMFQMLPAIMQAFPLPTMDPLRVARAIWREFLRAMRVENTQAFLGSPAQDFAQSQMLGMPGMGMMPPLMGPVAPPMAPPMAAPPMAPPPGPPPAPETGVPQ